MAVACSSTGDGYETHQCDLGCTDVPVAHCKYVQPKYLPDICDTAATAGPLTISTTGSLDPNLDNLCTGGVVAQASAPSICVIRNSTITIAASGSLTIEGLVTMSGRPIAFVADSDIDISGTIDGSAHTSKNGPGGGSFYSGTSFPTTGSTVGGVGGAGGATNGGDGATGNSMSGGADGGAMNGGSPTMNPALVSAFFGGASTLRASGGTDDTYFAGGGGAVMLISCHGTVSVSGTINVSGGGGIGGTVNLFPFPATGGGAGGNLVIQGRNVSVTGKIFSNGGAGGGGWHPNGSQGQFGSDGLMASLPAVCMNSGDGSGTGGNGGYGATTPSDGLHPTSNGSGPGGGGGSVGFLQVYTPAGVSPGLTPSVASPPFQPNGVLEAR
ncbi:MAG: hypothetical protein ABJE66_33035 [Deltaproteobacteria bacterium]